MSRSIATDNAPDATETPFIRGEAEEYRFGSFRLVTGRRELLSREGPVRLGSRAFDVLLALVKRQGQLVTKDELLAEVWLGRAVEENNLQAQISALRKVLASDADCARALQTIPGHGYRFVGRVEHKYSVDQIAGTADAPRKFDATQLPLPDKPSIAVVPFANLSSDPQQEYFSDGITDDIVTELSRFSELLVIASNSSFKLKGSAFDVRKLGANSASTMCWKAASEKSATTFASRPSWSMPSPAFTAGQNATIAK